MRIGRRGRRAVARRLECLQGEKCDDGWNCSEDEYEESCRPPGLVAVIHGAPLRCLLRHPFFSFNQENARRTCSCNSIPPLMTFMYDASKQSEVQPDISLDTSIGEQFRIILVRAPASPRPPKTGALPQRLPLRTELLRLPGRQQLAGARKMHSCYALA